MKRAALLSLAMASASWASAAEEGEREAASSTMLHYDIQIAWIQAGQIIMRLTRRGERYVLSGRVATSGLMDRFFRWRGRFISTGRMAERFPRTDAYMLWGDDGEEQETMMSFGGTTTITKGGRSERREQPIGSDFMSVTFLAPHCVEETTLHDGKRLYRLFLEDEATTQLERRGRYHFGPAERCDYRFRYADGSTRRLSLWMGDWRGQRLPLRIRVRVPLLPDGNMMLRSQPSAPEELVDRVGAGR